MSKGKFSSGVDLPLPVNAPGVTKQERAYQAIRDAILNGLLQASDRLPSTRVLSQRWGIARGTVESVFERLQLEGYITRKVGSGSLVSAVIPDSYLKAVTDTRTGEPDRNESVEIEETPVRQEGRYRAQVGVPFVARLASPLLIAPAEWAAHLQRAMAAMKPEQMCDVEPQGAWVLRDQIAQYLRKHRGIDCRAEQLLITNGIRHSIDLVARCVLKPGDDVCVEDPGYPAVHRIFEKAGANLLYAPIDNEGIDLHGISDSAECRLAYVTPAHQSPLGVIMSATRRLELLDWAQRQNAWIIEDDYDSEFNYQSAPLPALKSIDSMKRVVYCGSFNQALFSNLRLGYILAPPELHHRILALWHTIGRSVGVSEQLGLAEFMRGPAFLRHLRRSRQEYQTLRDIVLDTLMAEAPGRYRISGEHAGFHLILWLSPDQDEDALVREAERLGLMLQPLRNSCREIDLPPAFVLGFAALTRAQARNSARQLARLLH
ncbi:MocR-like pyridoxine biosynthesis transcription factor PdxR [Zestomonas carbonaria]|uniref:HTH-type transcriptional regulatory protein GabR n=1 Tax=Zestomonas carbonaria TaxID=2762745 RepID=A0A7U7EPX2_9GAMM|nr:PLP-dependent aminotransferase family protein [Pseudomonas carbonaria]CAD5108472.1 HTH-type transcriptional regulatory protein GabR [Pseudomonas carbonaria]